MKELKAKRVPPGDRWSIAGGEEVYSSLTELLNAIYKQTKSTEFFVDAKAGEVHIEDGVEPPVEIETYSMYGEEL
tara:strand:+ start:508 stop:732 length:225 start_codon:yes stop_codon:yes gene_type:complete